MNSIENYKETSELREFEEFCIPIRNVVKKSDGRKIVIYGYGESGIYLEWLLKEYFNITVDYIVDKNRTIYGCPINRPNLFEYLKPEETIVLLTMSRAKDIEKELSELGTYMKYKNVFNMKEEIYGTDEKVNITFFSFLEYYYKVDLLREDDVCNLDYANIDANRTSPSRQMSMNILFKNFVTAQKNSIIDIGCGRGAGMILLKNCGFTQVDGIELSKNLCDIAQNNLDELQLEDMEIYNVDAGCFHKFRDYNFFYFYNPFQGDTFRKVIKNIEDSYQEKKRSIHIVYANPYCHKTVIQSGFFELVEQLPTEYDCRLVNIYRNRGMLDGDHEKIN